MPTAVPSTSTIAQSTASAPLAPAGSRLAMLTYAPTLNHSARRHAPRTSDIDSLLKIAGPGRAPRTATQTGPEAGEAVDAMHFDPEMDRGIFLGLRSALLFNASLGILCMLAYEAWSALLQ